MIFGNGRGMSSQVVAIPMASFGMLMNSTDSELQRISPQTPTAPAIFEPGLVVRFQSQRRLQGTDRGLEG